MTTANYNIDYFHYTLLPNFDYELDIKEYRFTHGSTTKTITSNCVKSYLRIPRIIDPMYPIYDLHLEITDDAEDAYVKITEVLPPSYFNNYTDLPEVIDEIKNPKGLWMYIGKNPAGRIPGITFSSSRVVDAVNNGLVTSTNILNSPYIISNHCGGPCGDLINGTGCTKGGVGLNVCQYGMDGGDIILDILDISKHTMIWYKCSPHYTKLNDTPTTSENSHYYNYYNSKPVYPLLLNESIYGYTPEEVDNPYNISCTPSINDIDFEELGIPTSLTLEQVKSHRGFIGTIEYIIGEHYDPSGEKPLDWYPFCDGYQIADIVSIYLFDTSRGEYTGETSTSASTVVNIWKECVTDAIDIATPTQKENIIPYLTDPTFSTIDGINRLINMTPKERGLVYTAWENTHRSVSFTVSYYGIEYCLSMIKDCILPALYDNTFISNHGSNNNINGFDLSYDSVIKYAPQSWNDYTVNMACSLLLPTFEKDKKIKDLNKMKIKDIYTLYKEEDNFNIKNYYNYISKLKKHLLDLGFDSKSFIATNFKNIKELSPDITLVNNSGVGIDGPGLSIDSKIDEAITKWNEFVIFFRNMIRQNLLDHFTKYEVDSDIINKYLEGAVQNYTENFTDNSFFYPKNLYNIITNNCRFHSRGKKINNKDVFRTFYSEVFWHHRIYNGNYYVMSTIIPEYLNKQPIWTEDVDRYTYVIYPCMNPFQHSVVYGILDPTNELYINMKEIGNILGIQLKIPSHYNIRNIMIYDQFNS